MKKFFATIALGALLAAGMYVWADGGLQGQGTDVKPAAPFATVPANLQTTQVIAAGNTITADSCGGIKFVSAAGAVATSATNAITAPAAGNLGCAMTICNVSSAANTITYKHSTANLTSTGVDVALAQNSCIGVVSNGTVWYQTVALTTSS